MLHDRDSRGALAYLALAGEMIRRSEEPEAYYAENAPAGAEAAEPGGTALTLVENDAPPPASVAEPESRAPAAAEEPAPSSPASVPYLTNH
jgi:hypothetical protein